MNYTFWYFWKFISLIISYSLSRHCARTIYLWSFRIAYVGVRHSSLLIITNSHLLVLIWSALSRLKPDNLVGISSPSWRILKKIFCVKRKIIFTPVMFSKALLQPFTEIIETNAKNGVVPISHKQCKTLFNDHTVRLKIISLYIYKDLRLKT